LQLKPLKHRAFELGLDVRFEVLLPELLDEVQRELASKFFVR
jgi:hypothetical protein